MQLLGIRFNSQIRDANYHFSLPLIKKLKEIAFTKPVTFIVGENGSGKSTIIEGLAVACGLPVIGASDTSSDDSLIYARNLAKAITLSWKIRNHRGFFMRAEDFFGFQKKVASLQAELKQQESEYNEKYSGYARFLTTGTTRAQRMQLEKKYGENPDAFSHGESFLNLFMNRLVPQGLYILDEPEVPLSPSRQLALLSLLKKQVELGSQFIIATHSPILMAYPDADILEIQNDKLVSVRYEDLEQVKLVKDFLSDPQLFIKHL